MFFKGLENAEGGVSGRLIGTVIVDKKKNHPPEVVDVFCERRDGRWFVLASGKGQWVEADCLHEPNGLA